MKLRSVATISLIFCAMFQQSATAELIKCENQRQHYLYWTQEYFDLADAVFFGKVVSEETPARQAWSVPTPGNASSMAELLEMIQAGQSSTPQQDRLQTAIFEIHKSWKGPAGPTIAVKANLYVDDTGHHAVLRTGASYLVFAFKSDDEEIFHIPVGCTSHESVKETASKIRVLDALTKKPGDR
jgi:hypothetical protein